MPPNDEYLVSVRPLHGGTQWLYEFPNGFEVSVVDTGYGRQAGLKEMMVSKDGENVVEGWLNDADIRQNLTRIRLQGASAELVVSRAPRSRLARVPIQPYIRWRS